MRSVLAAAAIIVAAAAGSGSVAAQHVLEIDPDAGREVIDDRLARD